MIVIDGSVAIQVVNFIFLIWILNIVLYKPIRKVLLQRKEKISGLEKNIESFARDTDEKDDSIAAELRSAKQKGLKELEALIGSAEEEEKRLVAAIQDKAQAELDAIRDKLTRDAEQISKSLHQDVDIYAREIGQKILGRAV